jgi:hypothetical protein
MTMRLGSDPNFIPILRKILFHGTDLYNNYFLLSSQPNNTNFYQNIVNSCLNVNIQANKLDLLAADIINGNKKNNVMMTNLSTSLSKEDIAAIIILIVIVILFLMVAYYSKFLKAPAKATGQLAEKAEINGGANAAQLQQYVDTSGFYDAPTGYGYLGNLSSELVDIGF